MSLNTCLMNDDLPDLIQGCKDGNEEPRRWGLWWSQCSGEAQHSHDQRQVSLECSQFAGPVALPSKQICLQSFF